MKEPIEQMDVPEQKTAGDNTPQTTRPGEGGYEDADGRDGIESGYVNDSSPLADVGSIEDPGLLTNEEWLGGELPLDAELDDAVAGEEVDHDFGEDEDVLEDDEAIIVEGEEP